MSFWVLMQILVNVTLIAAAAVLWIKLNRPAKDDPRLSKGLQLLQSKIAVLEDLSDRTEVQVGQLTSLMEAKIKEIQQQVILADRQIERIMESQEKSMEVAKIFQDKIPHEEILERQSTIKYVKAAKMAHLGRSIDEICQTVDLSRGEVEFIAKVNRDQLQFSETELPAWAKEGLDVAPAAPVRTDFSKAFEPPSVDLKGFKKLGDDLKKTISEQNFIEINPETESRPVHRTPYGAGTTAYAANAAARNSQQQADASRASQVVASSVLDKVTISNGKSAIVTPVQFRKITKEHGAF